MSTSNRYNRQSILPEIGKEGQQKLAAASVLCVGAGGLGSPALLYLAAAGVGCIGIIDFDHVDTTNLHRQIIFQESDTNKPKAAIAKQRLYALNPDLHIDAYEEALTTQNAPELFKKYDIILDGTDNFDAKYLINDAAVKYNKPWIYGAIQGFDGQVSIFDAAQGPCYRCLFPDPPKAKITSCAEAGVLGTTVGLVGITQSHQVIQLIVNHSSFEPLLGTLWTIDTKTMQTKTLKIPKNPACTICSHQPNNIILPEASATACVTIKEISPLAVQKKEGLLIDVRERSEWEAGHIPLATHWPLSKFEVGDLPKPGKNQNIFLYCQKGKRSLQAAAILEEHGYKNVYSMTGGYDAYLSFLEKDNSPPI